MSVCADDLLTFAIQTAKRDMEHKSLSSRWLVWEVSYGFGPIFGLVGAYTTREAARRAMRSRQRGWPMVMQHNVDDHRGVEMRLPVAPGDPKP